MKTVKGKPIHFDRRQVALMVELSILEIPDFAKQVGEIKTRVKLMAAGILDPTPSVLKHFELVKVDRGYQWTPR